MRKQSWKKKEQTGGKPGESNGKQNYDSDTAAFIAMSHEIKDEGNKLFQNKDYEGATLKYEKAIKLLPGNHIDVSYLRSKMAECYIQMGVNDYPQAIHECNLALEVTPKYSKALLKRARCYEALERFELAKRDVTTVLKMEPKNLTALEIFERVKKTDKSGIESPQPSEKKLGKKKGNRSYDAEEKKAEDKLVVEEEQEGPIRNIKLVFGEDIRWAPVPINCSILKLREIISERFPSSKAILVKYKDQEGDLVTITTNEELRWAEACGDHGSLKLYIVEVSPERDPLYSHVKTEESICKSCVNEKNASVMNNVMEPTCIDDWIIQFAQIFKNYVGLDSDGYLGIHELGFKVYSEAMEEAVTSEEAQDLFNSSAEKFQEMAALALFNWGNVHMSQAKKRLYFIENDHSSVKAQVFSLYDWAKSEYVKAGKRYEEALKIKPDFYEAVLALGQQQFEQAKLYWYYALATDADLQKWPFSDVIQLYNYAEDNMDKGMQMWETTEEKRINELSNPCKVKLAIQEMGLGELFKDWLEDETVEKSSNMRSQINLLWGKMLYERSSMEFKLKLPVWQEGFEIGIEKFQLAGASETDIALIVKNHCSNDSTVEGIGFNIDEIVQAWNEMYEAKRWETGVRSSRLEPLLRRRVSKLCHDLEHV
ncbi:protein PHOX1-like [Impatiens glandulifera]|uniref:protein PHOX1-like n=1 Tax=Impatiens glandulifera TaxID=253017 RepID=UPI001FB0725F|nr:protein PHOX1-like [Impatiens glandulifera]